MKRIIGILIFTGIWAAACVETEPVSPVPEIGFKSLEVFYAYDSLDNLVLAGELIFDFIDGDADFGMYRGDIIADPEDSSGIDWDENNYNVIMCL